ncbi:NACHT domain-containing protein [Saccharopolyspora sp. NPDC002578]
MANRDEIHNQITGPVRGNVLQTGNVHGDLLVWQQPPDARHVDESLREPLWRLRREVREASAEAVRTWGISSSGALAVRWRTATDELGDHPENIHGNVDPVSLEGQFTAVRDTYQAVRSKRLVIVGQAGAGKTVLAHRLILDLLDTGPVPVLFSLGGWNPASTDLQPWLIQQLLRDFGFLNGSNSATGEIQGQVLVQENLILPVLDGFDEIPHQHHPAAIRKISDLDSPLVITSRQEEYRDAAHTVRAVGRAAAIELQDITPAEAHRYLRLSAGKSRSRDWDTVFGQLHTHPDQTASQSLTHVLRTPLMVTLTRNNYNDTAHHHPSELLDTERFPTTTALEDHLLHAYLGTIYPSSRDTGPRRPRHTQWNPDRSRHWLGHLADHLQRRHTHDLIWWHLPTTLHRHTRILLTAATVGLGFALLLGPALGYVFGLDWLLSIGLPFGLSIGLAAGLAVAFVNEVGISRRHPGQEPERLRLGLRHRSGVKRTPLAYIEKSVSEFTNGLVVGLVGGLVGGLTNGLVFGPEFGFARQLVFGLEGGLMVGLLIGLIYGHVNIAVSTLADSHDPHATDPWTLLTRDRKVALVRTIASVLTAGLVVVVAILIGGSGYHDAHLENALQAAFSVGIMAGLVRLAFSAWGSWLLFARLWLPLTGRLPWRTKRFLEDAYDRGVLRTTGAAYQFRHARLRDHLAEHHRTPRRNSRTDQPDHASHVHFGHTP